MALPTSDIDICNLALDRLGQASAASINPPETTQEIICARHYDKTRRKLLRAYIFNFSKKYDTLTKDPLKVPAFGFANAFSLPNDFLRLLALGDSTVEKDIQRRFYDFSEGFIFTDASIGDELQITYIKDAILVGQFDALFVDSFVLMLAADMAYKFSLKPSLVKAIRDELGESLVAAAAVAGQEKPPRRIERSKLRRVRRRGGIFGDPSRV